MDGFPFIKMHGLGNDFVVLDARARPLRLSVAEARAIADRRTGVGCDQIIILAPSSRADALMRIHNADGEEVGACGNGTRCVGALLMAENSRERVVIETRAGLLAVSGSGGGTISVDMGEPGLDWRRIPLARPMDTLHLDLSVGPASAPVLEDPAAVDMGNPHAVFFVADAEAVDLMTIGPMIEHHPLFPERANVSVAQVLDRGHVRLRVWERGVGITSACGTAACATLVAAARRGLTERSIEAGLDGGILRLEWNEAGHVIMAGPVATSFTGVLAPELAPCEIAA